MSIKDKDCDKLYEDSKVITCTRIILLYLSDKTEEETESFLKSLCGGVKQLREAKHRKEIDGQR